jgi:hypothetical protein
MARSVRHLTGIAALLAERGIGLAGRFTFHVLAAMDEMLADLISEGYQEAWPPPGPQPGRRPQAQALCPAGRGGQGHVRRDRQRREAPLCRRRGRRHLRSLPQVHLPAP